MTFVRTWRLTLATFGLAAVMFMAGGLGFLGDRVGGRSGESAVETLPAGATRGDLTATIASLQNRLERIPNDASSWASLGLSLVEQAKATGDPSYYVQSERALRRSLRVDTESNYLAPLGMAALAAARHDFPLAQTWAKRGLAVNPSNAPLYGVLADAETQVGNFNEGMQAVQRMLDISPDASALARASYSWELRGDITQARALMERALSDAPTPSAKTFARYFLGEMALNQNDPAGAVAHDEAGLLVDPKSAALLQGRAKAKQTLGDTDGALRDFAQSVANGPEPGYFIEYGELLESVGRDAEAKLQYKAFEDLQRRFAKFGERPDVDAVLFYADHGDPVRALRVAEEALKTRGIVDMYDAYSWALHRNGRHLEAREWAAKARSLGTKNALFEFHAGAIEASLGRLDEARAHFAKALAINPEFHALHAAQARAALA